MLALTRVAFCSEAINISAIVRNAKPAVVQLLVSDSQGQVFKAGTGFFVTADGLLITNYHVVEGGHSITAVTATGAYYQYVGGLPGKVDDPDISVLRFHATGVPHLDIDNSSEVVEGQRVLVIGNPEGLQGTVSDGIVSAIREDGELIQITAPISHGSSGSPVLNEDGQVIGVATSIFKEGQNLGPLRPLKRRRFAGLCRNRLFDSQDLSLYSDDP
jgi:S1-C subfamily serine protease